MNCKEAKMAIDTQPRRSPYGEVVKSHLSGCPDCHHYADETNALLSLLSAQPRVQAPADFDFRLRARIARAQSEERRPLGFLEGLWTGAFSWGQAATAIAAFALVATFSTYYINYSNQQSAPVVTQSDVAQVQSPASEETIAKSDQGVIQAARSDAHKASRLTPAKFTARSVKVSAPALEPAVATSSVAVNVPSNDDSTRFYNAERRQLLSTSNREVALGVQDAGLAKPAVALTF
jgi:hypothetical protein